MLGWIAGDVIASDPIVVESTGPNAPFPHEKFRLFCAMLGSAGVLLGGRLLRVRRDQLV